MTHDRNQSVADQARAWAIRVADPAFTDWDGMTAWLEADPAHLVAYNRAADDDAWATELMSADVADHPAPTMAAAANDDSFVGPEEQNGWRPWWRAPWIGGVAAALLLAVGVGGFLATRPAPSVDYRTAPGERRTITLPDGSQIALNSDTHVRFAPDNPREIELESGEALFTVHHDEKRPFVVTSGQARLIDVGTVFNVAQDRGRLDVAVAEGTILYSADSDQVRLGAGKALSQAGPGATVVVTQIDPGSVAGWQTNLLTYDDAPLTRVASDLGRNLGLQIDIDPRLQGQHFSGTLTISGSPAQVMARLQAISGLSIVGRATHWTLRPGHVGKL